MSEAPSEKVLLAPVHQTPMLPPCRVCGEKASGFHYGVNTCEACKAFFRRSQKRSEVFQCAWSESCDIQPGRRSSCSYCRFKKCVTMGMCKDAIKTGRYTHEKKAMNIKEVKGLRQQEALKNLSRDAILDKLEKKSTPMPIDQNACETDYTASSVSSGSEPNSITSGIGASPENVSMSPVDVKMSIGSDGASPGDLNHSPRGNVKLRVSSMMSSGALWFDMDKTEYYESIIQDITDVFKSQYLNTEEFLQQVPEKEKEYLEQLALKKEVFGPLKAMTREEYLNFYQATGIDVDGRREMVETLFVPQFETCIKHLTRFAKTIPGFKSLCVEDQISLIKTSRFETWMIACHRRFNLENRLLITPSGSVVNMEEMGKLHDMKCVEILYATQKKIKSLNLSVEETCVLSAFALMFSDQCPLKDPDIVEQSQEVLLCCLGYLFHKQHPEEQMRFPRVVNCLLHMRSSREEHQKAEERFVSDWKGIIAFPPLVYEMWSS